MSAETRYRCPPIDQHCEFPTGQMAQRHLEQLLARLHTGPGWPTWYFRVGRTIYSQIQVPIHLRAPASTSAGWALATLQRMKEAGIYGDQTEPAPPAVGDTYALF